MKEDGPQLVFTVFFFFFKDLFVGAKRVYCWPVCQDVEGGEARRFAQSLYGRPRVLREATRRSRRAGRRTRPLPSSSGLLPAWACQMTFHVPTSPSMVPGLITNQPSGRPLRTQYWSPRERLVSINPFRGRRLVRRMKRDGGIKKWQESDGTSRRITCHWSWVPIQAKG